ncbi:MAG: hypothetical protein B7X93_09855 [Hydrogenophilales bacterium 17-61-9]|nr:MAG: hypothetical protein B7X93_09855 [Hydrogenophilales bacterium 17-61-9]
MEYHEISVWIPAITGLAGAFIGAVSSFIPNLITEYFRRKQESRQLKESLIAEIAAMMEIAELRKYRQGLRDVCTKLENSPKSTLFTFPVGIPNHYSRIYQANANRIGIIDPKTAIDIVTFHHLIDAVVQDVNPGGPLADGCDLDGYQEALAILDKAYGIATKLICRT